MTATGQNLAMYQGEYKELRIPIVDGASEPVDLAGATARWVVYGGSETALTKTSEDGGGIIVNTTEQRLEIVLEATDTASLPVGVYQHQAMLTKANRPAITTTGTLTITENRAD
jgi:hypothetical protein